MNGSGEGPSPATQSGKVRSRCARKRADCSVRGGIGALGHPPPTARLLGDPSHDLSGSAVGTPPLGSGPPAEGPPQPIRRKRTVYTKEQIDYLKRVFATNPYPGEPDLEKMKATLGVGKGRLRIWFQNRRSREKQKQAAIRKRLAEQQNFAYQPQQACAFEQTRQNKISTAPSAIQLPGYSDNPHHSFAPFLKVNHTPGEVSFPGVREESGQQEGRPCAVNQGPPSAPQHMDFYLLTQQGASGSPCGPSPAGQEVWTLQSNCTYMPSSNNNASAAGPLRDPATQWRGPVTQADPSGWMGNWAPPEQLHRHTQQQPHCFTNSIFL